jgi:hypothetical protein
MGQYYLIVNLDKKQYLHPHRCGDGLKLLEFACSATGTLTALAILLADGNGRGGGDLHSSHPVIGSWAGDRIVIAGDYADEGRFTGDVRRTLFRVADEEFQDISRQALRAMADDVYVADEMKRSTCWDSADRKSVYDFAMGGTPKLELIPSDDA